MTLTHSKNSLLFSIFFILSLTFALFYTGKNSWLFTLSYLFIVLNLALVLQQRFKTSINISVNAVFISVILLLTWFAISIFPSQVKYLSIYNFFWVGSILIIFLIFTFNENKDQVWNTIWPAILFIILAWAIYGLVQYYYLHVPANASFLNRNSLAALINLALIPASGYFLLDKSNLPWKFFTDKLLSVSLIILFLTTFIITSRGGSLSLLLGFTIFISLLYKHVNKSKIYSLFIIIFISFLIATISQYFIANLPDSFAERMVTLKDAAESGNTRFIIWKSLLPLFNEMPWYGLGLGSLWLFWTPYRPYTDTSAGFFAHNDYIQITLEAGYPGIILLSFLFIFILLKVIHTVKSSNSLTLTQRIELISLFSALTAFAAHSFFTYNFYILPLLLIAGLYLGRIQQITNIESISRRTIPALKTYFKPFMFFISALGIVFILASYFVTLSLSSDYNNKAKELMTKNKYRDSNAYFLKAQKFAPLMDNPFFSHADLLRRGASRLIKANKIKQANSLIKYAHENLDKAQKLNPLRPQTHHVRGLVYELTDPVKAKIEFEKALQLDPRYLFSRIRLAVLLHDENKLKEAIQILYKGIRYNYPANKVMLDYMTLFAKYSREAGVESFARHLEENIKKFQQNNHLNP